MQFLMEKIGEHVPADKQDYYKNDVRKLKLKESE